MRWWQRQLNPVNVTISLPETCGILLAHRSRPSPLRNTWCHWSRDGHWLTCPEYSVGFWSCALVLSVSYLSSAPVASETLYSKNLSPVAGLLGLPSQRGPVAGAAGSWQIATHASWASHFVVDDGRGETLLLDGETRRLALDLRYNLAPGWDLRLELPWLSHGGGSLDSLIDGWHDLWGMPDGGRDAAPRDRLAYRYAGGGGGGFGFDDSASGVGDVTLAVSRTLWSGPGAQLDAALGAKLATGDEDDFLGSGSEDGFLALRTFWSPGEGDWRWSGQLGYLRAGRVESVGERGERDLWFAGANLEWQAWPAVSLLMQLDSHAAPLQASELAALGDTALLLTAGVRWRIQPHWAVEVSVVEDVQVESGPDVVFQASLRFSP